MIKLGRISIRLGISVIVILQTVDKQEQKTGSFTLLLRDWQA